MPSENNRSTSKILPFQPAIRPALPTVLGNVDYTVFSQQLVRIDQLLRKSGVETLFVERSLEVFEQKARRSGAKLTVKARLKHQKHSFGALRCTVLMSLLGESFRGMSRRLAECQLFRWFCQIEELGPVRVPGKSTLQEYANWLPAAEMRCIVNALLQAAAAPPVEGAAPLNLANAIELDNVWMDATCVKANIHFPIDWVLLRDATRTLMKATALIRKHGLKNRMAAPEVFLTQMNRLCMAMTHCRRRQDSKKRRKKNLRLMKLLLKKVRCHALRHRDLLEGEWQSTDWTYAQAQVVLRRIDAVLALLPAAQRQAHERIIGERAVENSEKILSLYEPQVRVIVRGKAGAEVEFGNTLFLVEQKDGLIVDWDFHEESVDSEAALLPASLQRLEEIFGAQRIKALGADRGFDTAHNVNVLQERSIYNGLCPRSPHLLKERLGEEKFAYLQKRRAQIEGRVGLFKNVFLGRPLRAKTFAHRQGAIGWHVLAHNLWVLARLETAPALGPPDMITKAA